MFKESPVKRKFRLVQDLKEKSAIGRTISLVEKRVSNDTSENPIRDLAFLSEQYHARGEWDKADSASRQMLRLAEGHEANDFAITPVDLDLMLDRKRLRRQMYRQLIPVAAVLVVACSLAVVVQWNDNKDPDWRIFARASIFSWDSNAQLDKASLLLRRGEIAEAFDLCNKVLAASADNKAVHRVKAECYLSQGDYKNALSEISLADQSDIKTFRLTSRVLFWSHRYAEAAMLPFDRNKPPVHGLQSWDYCRAGFAFAAGGDYEAAVSAAETAMKFAATDQERCSIYADQARWLVHLGRNQEVLDRVDKALAVDARHLSYDKSRACLYRGEALLAMGDFTGALEQANRSIALCDFAGRQYQLRAKALYLSNPLTPEAFGTDPKTRMYNLEPMVMANHSMDVADRYGDNQSNDI